MILTIPDVPPSLNVLLRLNWRNQYALRRKWNLLVRSQLNGNYLKGTAKVRATITFHHARFYDRDNAYGAAKLVVDALKDWRLIYDDSKKFLDLNVEQEQHPHKRRFTTVELEPAAPQRPERGAESR
jgi:hypothetical protein